MGSSENPVRQEGEGGSSQGPGAGDESDKGRQPEAVSINKDYRRTGRTVRRSYFGITTSKTNYSTARLPMVGLGDFSGWV